MLTAAGGEEMVIEPLGFVARGGCGLLRSATKRRGGEYLRIIYGPDSDRADNLARLKKRRSRKKRSISRVLPAQTASECWIVAEEFWLNECPALGGDQTERNVRHRV